MKRVRVEPRVTVVQPFHYGFKPQGYSLTIALSNMITDGIYARNSWLASELMERNKVDVAEIVRDRFTVQVCAVEPFQVVDDEADGVFVLSIEQYGFDHHTFKPSKRIPFLLLHGELQDKTGKRIWSGSTGLIATQRKDVGTSWEEYEASPDKLRQDWQRQSETAVRYLLRIR